MSSVKNPFRSEFVPEWALKLLTDWAIKILWTLVASVISLTAYAGITEFKIRAHEDRLNRQGLAIGDVRDSAEKRNEALYQEIKVLNATMAGMAADIRNIKENTKRY